MQRAVQKVTQETIQECKHIYEKYKDILNPEYKSIEQVIEYLKNKYSLEEETSEKFKSVVIDNIIMNE